jgi:hypothetical protein
MSVLFWKTLLLNDIRLMQDELSKNNDFIRLFEMRNKELNEQIEKRKCQAEKVSHT